jgi:hypothetical protein
LKTSWYPSEPNLVFEGPIQIIVNSKELVYTIDNIDVAVLWVCRQLEAEGTNLLYSRNLFMFVVERIHDLDLVS